MGLALLPLIYGPPLCLFIYFLILSWRQLQHFIRLDANATRNRHYHLDFQRLPQGQAPSEEPGPLRLATSTLEKLGFHFLEDLAFQVRHGSGDAEPLTEAPLADPLDDPVPEKTSVQIFGFERVFAHGEQGCIGRIVSADFLDWGSRQAEQSFQLRFDSYSGTGESGWQYTTISGNFPELSDLAEHLLLRPRRLFTQFEAGAGINQILAFHLKRRNLIASAGAFVWDKNPDTETVLAAESRNAAEIRARYAKLSSVTYWLKGGMKPRAVCQEWLGELGGRIPVTKRQF